MNQQELPPTAVAMGTTPMDIARRIMVVDAVTGAEIPKVISADSATGAVRRFDVDADGNLVREGDSMRIVEETRAIRLEWRSPPAEQASTVDEDPGADAPPAAVADAGESASEDA